MKKEMVGTDSMPQEAGISSSSPSFMHGKYPRCSDNSVASSTIFSLSAGGE